MTRGPAPALVVNARGYGGLNQLPDISIVAHVLRNFCYGGHALPGFTGLVIVIGVFAAASASADIVVRVKDGDSIVVLSGDREVEVRLANVDAPELDQAFGTESKRELKRLVNGQDVRLALVSGDAYRRIVAHVFVGPMDVGATLVEGGFAWVRRAYSPGQRLIALEDSARASKRGLWALSDPVPPWMWRKGLRPEPSAPAQESDNQFSVKCGSKNSCKEMRTCEEAIAYLHKCGLAEIDGDGDGIPCEKLCRYYR